MVSRLLCEQTWVVERMHAKGIIVMNMIGSPKHVKGCLAAGVDIICAQGGEGGGHTGSVSSLVLLPQVVDMCAGTNLLVVGAGGIVNGRGIAAALALGGKHTSSRFMTSESAHSQRLILVHTQDTSALD